MKKEIIFALFSIKKNIASNAELRTSFVTMILGMAINNSAFLFLWVFFVKSVGVINGWTETDIFGLMGFSSLAYGIVQAFTGGIRRMVDTVTNGNFDRLLLSPKNLLMRTATHYFGVSAVGDIIFGVVCLAIYAISSSISWQQLILIIGLSGITTLVFLAISIAIFSVSFLVVEANTVTEGIFELFMTPTLFHGGIFQGGFRLIFTLIIPSLLVGAVPVEIVRKPSLEMLGVMVGIAVLWMILAIKIFYFGVRRYESTNLITFGS